MAQERTREGIMTPRLVLDLAVALERDLADFYQKIGEIDRLRQFADIFSFMVDHSANHAVQIETLSHEEYGHRDYILEA